MLNNTNNPLVTVVIQSYNRIKFLEQALKSVFNQTFEDYEVVVINDGSTDGDYSNHDYIDKIHQINLKTNQKIYMDLDLVLFEIMEIFNQIQNILHF